jgi:hypothetical protein
LLRPHQLKSPPPGSGLIDLIRIKEKSDRIPHCNIVIASSCNFIASALSASLNRKDMSGLKLQNRVIMVVMLLKKNTAEFEEV